jgi:nucleoid-associated protein YgaU
VTNDAKLGLVVGVALVIAVAVVFFRKESAPTPPPNQNGSAPAIPLPNEAARPPQGRPSVLSAGAERRHTVAPGETLAGVAEQYYGDPDRAGELYRANRDRLRAPQPLDPGTELIIPELPPTRASAGDAGS